MARATKLTIDLSAVASNFELAGHYAPDSKNMAVVKANAYGHGVKEIVNTLHNAPGFAVATIDEAIELRALTEKPILILQGCFRIEELTIAKKNYLTPTVHSKQQLSIIQENPDQIPESFWIIMDTGMARLGFKGDEVIEVINSLNQLESINSLVVCSHMANASSPETNSNQQQCDLLIGLQAEFPDLQFSLANSAATIVDAKYQLDWNRIGIMIYGGSPFDDIHHPMTKQLKPAMSLTAEVIAIRDLDAGESVGYGSTWTADKPTRIATLAVGYADGYPRHAPSGTPVFINGNRLPLAGRVSMDMIMVDVTEHPNVEVGDEAELFGNNISINEVAEAAGTISYELMTAISSRVPRVYIK